jgi:Early transcription elongation factor of RNA pol II, NGN section
VGQQGLLPTKSDARLWAVQCRPGCEREAVVCLLQKAVEFAARNERLGMGALGIKSAFAHDHIKVGASDLSTAGGRGAITWYSEL